MLYLYLFFPIFYLLVLNLQKLAQAAVILSAAEEQEAGETLGGFWKVKTETPFEESKRQNQSLSVREMKVQSGNSSFVEGEEEKKEEVHVKGNQKEIDNNGSFEGESLLEFDGRERGEFLPLWIFFYFNFFILINLLDVVVRFINMHVTIYDYGWCSVYW